MEFKFTRSIVEDQGRPPESFLTELVEWGRTAPDDIFEPNTDPEDVYLVLAPILGNPQKPRWDDLLHRRAAMLELMRVHGGMESGWDWREGVDTTNRRSMANPRGEETGLWQVSFDSTYLGKDMADFAEAHGIDAYKEFIPAMKLDHKLAMEYYARLMRANYKWAGPVIRERGDTVRKWLSKDSMNEFRKLLSA